MPKLNQTGPMGQGSMTGRKMGKCANFAATVQPKSDEVVQENLPLNGRGQGRGLGRGQGQGQNQGGRGMGCKNRGRNAN